jgi:hypothetical protein
MSKFVGIPQHLTPKICGCGCIREVEHACQLVWTQFP